MIQKNKQAFTLVELIVVITILAILGTIAFISLQGYATSARNSTRITDMGLIKKTLELYRIKEGKYPTTTNGQPVTYTGQTVWTQGTFGTGTIRETGKISKIPTDPLTGIEYTYSLLNTKQEYQIAGIFEGELALNNTIQTNAGNKTATAYTTGNYNGQVAKVSTGSITYVLAVPSIVVADKSINLLEIIKNNKFVFKGYKNLPSGYNGSDYQLLGETTDGGITSILKLINTATSTATDSDFVVYSGSLDLLSQTDQAGIDARTNLITNLQNSYSGTTIANTSSLTQLTSVDLNNTTEVASLASTIINNNLGGNITTVSNINLPICTFNSSTFGNCIFN